MVKKRESLPIYFLLFIPVIWSVMALLHSGFILKSGSAAGGMLILFILYSGKIKLHKDVLAILAAFAFSIAGDWFLSHKHGDTRMFVTGIGFFFLAHTGYLAFALINGRIHRIATILILTGYLLFYFIRLAPSVGNPALMVSSFVYLLISCLSLGAAFGLKTDLLVRRAFICGIALILFSDTIIAFKEFAGYRKLNYLILPTYYAAHICITFSLIRKSKAEDHGNLES
jgi:uncharacterized membrane protein YhhN